MSRQEVPESEHEIESYERWVFETWRAEWEAEQQENTRKESSHEDV